MLVKKLCLLLCVFFTLSSSAQWYDPQKVNTKLGYKYGEAINEARVKNYTRAMQLLDECIAADTKFVDAYLSKAGVFSEQKKYKQAVEFYRKATELDSVYCVTFLLPISIAYAGNGNFEDALAAINRFLQKPNLNERTIKSADYRKRCYQFAIDYKKTVPATYVFSPQNLGDSINSKQLEYFPSATIDGNTLVFTRRIGHEDFFISEKRNGAWSKAEPLPGNLNTEENEGAQTISQDGRMLIFTGCNMEDGEGSCDLYVSYLTKNGWGERINMGRIINTEYWESQPSLAPDKRTLYFAARDPSGFGGSDLFVSYLQPNGQWGTPRNMGPEVNTSADESCPFIHPDNQTFYFTSNGHPGYGGTDLYFMRKKDDGSWEKPQNLGYPVNTIDDEGSLMIAGDGKTAYYASDGNDSRGGLDLYSFELPEHARPYKTLWVKGNVFDAKTKQGLPSAVELINLASAQTISKVQTDEEGNYLITLPTGKDYAFNVNRRGYLFYSENFSLKTSGSDTTYTINIPLIPIEVNASVVLKNVFFDVNKAELKPESMIELDKVVQLMKDNPTLKIEINGHTDNVGKPADNLTLSNNRSKAVINYFLYKGVAAERLSSKGFGETKPVAENTNEQGRAKNRRTELKVVAK
ncbi:flagellar motor protein MotB [Lacibacter luteus]|uniref:Flagellar motor protein MotB n=2 Tax=Lacibacter luteus TaxID=2508719 RepID=A0A4Q1CP21_9BACT|nr:flagellar motor protein MotB [Lacibacter luteus]